MDARSLTKDFREFLKLLNDHGVEYLVVGGHAVAFHGYPRATADLDIWIAANSANAALIVQALKQFGFDLPTLHADLFIHTGRIIRMGLPPNRIEILTGIDGVTFSECLPRAIESSIDGVAIRFIGLADLKINKLASGRYKDLADLEQLP
jgi:predicted nucleotidyltransferase